MLGATVAAPTGPELFDEIVGTPVAAIILLVGVIVGASVSPAAIGAPVPFVMGRSVCVVGRCVRVAGRFVVVAATVGDCVKSVGATVPFTTVGAPVPRTAVGAWVRAAGLLVDDPVAGALVAVAGLEVGPQPLIPIPEYQSH
jgi:hypothetical protein